MWKSRKEDEDGKALVSSNPAPPAEAAVASARGIRPMETTKMDQIRPGVAYIGKSVVIKGELSGGEDLCVDGEVEGNIELRGHSLTIGPSGRIRANIHARDVVIQGKVDGNIHGYERVELKNTAMLAGDIFTQRIVIAEGAMLKGGIDIQKPEAKPPEMKSEVRREFSATAPGGSSATTTVSQQSAVSGAPQPASQNSK